MTVFAFYLFAALMIASGAFTIFARNPVHSVLWLILAFFNAAGLMIIVGAEFLAMLLVVVYVGAVAVLFLFVVMMLDVDFAELRGEFARSLPLGGLIALVLLAQLGIGFGAWQSAEQAEALRTAPIIEGALNTNSIGAILYDRYILPFQLAGLILLVAMIGAIVLTLRHRRDIKRQDVLEQMWRDPKKTMELRDVKPGQGL